jgi:hypothetical protein
VAKRAVVANGALKAPRIPKKRCRSGIKVHRAEYPRNHRNRRNSFRLLAVLIPTQQLDQNSR